MVDPKVLESPRLKVERANRHIDELINRTSPLSRDLYTLRIENDVGPTPDAIAPFALVYRPTKPIPETFALIIGDALHNLRSALDHLATGIVRTQSPTAEVHFPMRKARKDLVSPDARLAGTLCLIEQALPGAVDTLLKEVRPQGGPNEALWAFHALDNDDKHNLIIPTVTMVGVTNIHVRAGGIHLADCSMGGDAADPMYLIGSGAPITIHEEFETSVEVRFGPGKAFENDPVVPTLTQIAQIVTETINAFGRLIGA